MRLIAVVMAASLLGGCGSDEPEEGALAEAVAEQLGYLDPDSTAVAAIDLRWDGDNWDDLRPIVDRVFEAYRDENPGDALPGSAQGALEEGAKAAGLNFFDDVAPALDGHLVIGAVTTPGASAKYLLVYTTREGDVRKLAEAAADGEPLRPLEGYDDTLAFSDSSVAVVGTKTLVAAEDDGALRDALDRAEAGAGFSAERIAEAERDVAFDDPLVLATGDLNVARDLIGVGESDLQRARESVPCLRALRRGSVGIDVGEDAIDVRARVVTDGEALSEDDLPVGPAGELELPSNDAAATNGPDRIVFGLIGDAFVVATDEEMARRAAELDTEELDEEAAGAVRVPGADLLGLEGAEGQAFARVFDDLAATISADPDATVVSARLELRD